jgi:hypothetical protein
MVKPNFVVRYAEHLVHIGNARYVVYGVVEGTPIFRVQECDYKLVNGEKQVTKMIRLTLQQWLDLVSVIDVIEAARDEFDTVKLHIGRNTYIRVQPEIQRIDIREYFLPADSNCATDSHPSTFETALIPTRRGISLTYAEWVEFVSQGIPLINAGSVIVQAAPREACNLRHDRQEAWLMCNHCNPNGYLAW